MDRHGDGSVGLSCKQVVETSKVEVGSQVCGEHKKIDLKTQKRNMSQGWDVSAPVLVYLRNRCSDFKSDL